MFTPSLGGVQFSFLSQLQFFGGALRAAKSLGPSFCRIIARDSLSDLSVSSQDAGFQMLLPTPETPHSEQAELLFQATQVRFLFPEDLFLCCYFLVCCLH